VTNNKINYTPECVALGLDVYPHYPFRRFYGYDLYFTNASAMNTNA